MFLLMLWVWGVDWCWLWGVEAWGSVAVGKEGGLLGKPGLIAQTCTSDGGGGGGGGGTSFWEKQSPQRGIRKIGGMIEEPREIWGQWALKSQIRINLGALGGESG